MPAGVQVDLVQRKPGLGSMSPCGKPDCHYRRVGTDGHTQMETWRKRTFRPGKPESQFSQCPLPFHMQVQRPSQRLVLTGIPLRGDSGKEQFPASVSCSLPCRKLDVNHTSYK